MFASHSGPGSETVSSNLIVGFDYLRVADRHFNDVVLARHNCIPGEAKEVPRGA